MVPTLQSPVALVTGGVRGIGLAVARALRERGGRVHLTWRGSNALAAERAVEFGAANVHRVDALDALAVRDSVAAIVAREGRLDHVVHCVGEYHSGPLAELQAADLRRMLASNVESAFLLAREVLPELRRSRGSLVLFGCAGLDGHRARRTCAAYAAAKSALLVLARSYAVEEAEHGVRVNVCSPGIVPHEHAAADTLDPALAARVPLGRAGTPAEVAAVVTWLCSADASYVTGADIPVSGGWLA